MDEKSINRNEIIDTSNKNDENDIENNAEYKAYINDIVADIKFIMESYYKYVDCINDECYPGCAYYGKHRFFYDIYIIRRIINKNFVYIIDYAEKMILKNDDIDDGAIVKEDFAKFKYIANIVCENYEIFESCGCTHDMYQILIKKIKSKNLEISLKHFDILYKLADFIRLDIYIGFDVINHLFMKNSKLIDDYFMSNYGLFNNNNRNHILGISALHGKVDIFNLYYKNIIHISYRYVISCAIVGNNKKIIDMISKDAPLEKLLLVPAQEAVIEFDMILFSICFAKNMELFELLNSKIGLQKLYNSFNKKAFCTSTGTLGTCFYYFMQKIDMNVFGQSLICLHDVYKVDFINNVPNMILNIMYINGFNFPNPTIDNARKNIIELLNIDKNLAKIIADYYLPDEIYDKAYKHDFKKFIL